jgi:hypothetical protein
MLAWEYEAKESMAYDSSHWPGECFSKRDEELIGFLLFALGLQTMAINGLPLAESSPCELDHLLIPVSDQAHPIDHFGEESSSIATPRETEHINVVAGRIILHEELVSSNHMVGEGCADSFVFHFGIPVLELLPRASGTELCRCNVCPDSGLVVVETMPIGSVQHTEDLEDVAIA